MVTKEHAKEIFDYTGLQSLRIAFDKWPATVKPSHVTWIRRFVELHSVPTGHALSKSIRVEKIPPADGELIGYETQGIAIAAPRYSSEDLRNYMGLFQIDRVALRRNGMQEYQFRLAT